MASELSLKDQLAALHEPFRAQRALYGNRERVAGLLKDRHALLVQHRGADDGWGWGACASCKRNEKSFTECRGQGPLCLAHGPDRPDAGATLPVGTRLQWSVTKSAVPVVGVVTAYDAAREEHSVDVGGEVRTVNLVSNFKRVVVLVPGARRRLLSTRAPRLAASLTSRRDSTYGCWRQEGQEERGGALAAAASAQGQATTRSCVQTRSRGGNVLSRFVAAPRRQDANAFAASTAAAADKTVDTRCRRCAARPGAACAR